MKRLFRRILLWLNGDWWEVVQCEKTGKFGVYHPTRKHRWAYELTAKQAEAEQKRRNDLLVDGVDLT